MRGPSILRGETIIRSPEGALIMRKRCSSCGEGIEREVLGYWVTAGSLVSAREWEATEVRRAVG